MGSARIELRAGFDPKLLREVVPLMLTLPNPQNVYLAYGNADLRKSIDSLAALVQEGFGFENDVDSLHNEPEMKKIVSSFYPTWNESAFRKYLDDFQLPARRKVGDLSKGMKTKFALATALAHEPDLLIMDEPTSGLDPVFRREVLSILSEYIQEGTRSVLFSTHISTDLERTADYIVYIRRGQLRFCGSKEELIDSYMLVKGPSEWLRTTRFENTFLGLQQSHWDLKRWSPKKAILKKLLAIKVIVEKPSLDDILFYTREEK